MIVAARARVRAPAANKTMMDRLAKVAGHVTKGAFVGELSALGGMFERGLLSAAEFKAAKEQLLSPPAAAAAGTVAAAAATPSPGAPVEMTDHEKFLYDLQGFLHVPGFLSFAEVAALNGAFDANWGKRHWGVAGEAGDWGVTREAGNGAGGRCH